ncbi:MAG: polysaccharide pyruvyl transferase family protein [Prevotella sp.]|nr:polysaccharide pyruvyl transferase family protein [Prevotella sp.]
MKIGIVTYHRTLNYGAVMQSLATRFVLENMGCEVYYVDYWPDYHKEMYALFPRERLKKFNILQKAKFLFLLFTHYKSKKKRINNFEAFFKKHIYPYCRPIDESFDVVIYGSDQIWRKQKALGTYNPFYFGDNKIKTQHHISYAASMGILPDNDVDKSKVKELVSHLNKISVREEGLRQLLLSIGYSDVTLSLDPTLLLNSEQWDKHLPTKAYTGEKYVLVYILGSNPFNLREIKEFAKRKGLKTLILRGYASTKESAINITNAGPSEFVRFIKNAEYIFSASFHGLAFSIIYGKQFFTSFNGNANRAESLLNQLEIKGRLLPPKVSIPDDIKPIDYTLVTEKLRTLQEGSTKFLAEILK